MSLGPGLHAAGEDQRTGGALVFVYTFFDVVPFCIEFALASFACLALLMEGVASQRGPTGTPGHGVPVFPLCPVGHRERAG